MDSLGGSPELDLLVRPGCVMGGLSDYFRMWTLVGGMIQDGRIRWFE